MPDLILPDAASTAELIRVLLIEDSDSDAALVRGLLSRCATPRFQVIHETTCHDGIRRLATTPVDIVVLDLTLPDVRGLDTFRAIRPITSGIPVVILSGVDDDALPLAAVREGAQDFFPKREAISPSLGRLLQYAIERFHRNRAEAEISSAGFVQSRLIPKHPLHLRDPVSGFQYDLAGRCQPANQVGGDYFDYLMVDESHLMVVIGDVSGHGLGPALVMAETRAALRALATATDQMSVMIDRTNALIHDDELFWFVTLFVMRIDLQTGQALYVSAGHPAEIHHRDGTRQDLVSEDPPIGVRLGVPFGVHAAQLTIGDTLLIYTDGLNERRTIDGQEFGVDRVRQCVMNDTSTSAKQTVDRLFAAADAFSQGIPPSDDMTAVVMKIT